MALSEFEIKRIEKIVGKFVDQRRPAPEKRRQVDLAFRISGQRVELYELRPRWDDPTQTLEAPIARATFVKSTKTWKLYWQRADMKWHAYEPFRESASLEAILAVIDQDRHGCFWG